MGERAAVYRLFDANGELLYIGRTKRLPLPRLSEHEASQSWWDDVATAELVFMDFDEAFVEERRAILAENPPHNKERHPARRHRPDPPRVWEALPDELHTRLEKAGRNYWKDRNRASREALAAVIHQAFAHGCSPSDIGHACHLTGDAARRYAAGHAKRNPHLPPLPRRHGLGAARAREARIAREAEREAEWFREYTGT